MYTISAIFSYSDDLATFHTTDKQSLLFLLFMLSDNNRCSQFIVSSGTMILTNESLGFKKFPKWRMKFTYGKFKLNN